MFRKKQSRPVRENLNKFLVALNKVQYTSNLSAIIPVKKKVVPPGFEPGSPDPESEMIVHYTTGL